MVHKTAQGYYRIDRRITGVGRLALSVRSKNARRLMRLEDAITWCTEHDRLEALRALKVGPRRGGCTVGEFLEGYRSGTWGVIAAGAVNGKPFLALARKTIDGMKCSAETREFYREGLNVLERREILTAGTTLGQLGALDWDGAAAAWDISATSWRKARSAISRVLTVLFGKKEAETRTTILARIPQKVYEPREPALSVEQFWQIADTLPDPYRNIVIAKVATGMRSQELWRMRREDLRPAVYGVQLRGTKTPDSRRFLEMAPEIFAFVQAAVPVKLKEDTVRRRWKKACRALGIEPVTLHDLRHAFGQWTIDAGVSDADVQAAMGHKTPHMTRLYRKRQQTRVASEGMARVLIPSIVPSMTEREEQA